jgi:hypothetical protein
MCTEVEAFVIAARMRRACPNTMSESPQSKPQGSKSATTPAIPNPSPIQRRPFIRSARKFAAMGTVHRGVVHAMTDERPGGTI